ncbi:MAG: hypothetical protein QG657_1442 [Acidobacteriota bacterium]|nr:hypothetical protein [Acidobacteriota bacterium]
MPIIKTGSRNYLKVHGFTIIQPAKEANTWYWPLISLTRSFITGVSPITMDDVTSGYNIGKNASLEELLDLENFTSLLFYLGLLAIKCPDKDKLRLEIPNETVKRLYYDYIKGAYRETGVFALNLAVFANLMTDMAYNGKWQPLFEFITGRMRESISLRDLITGEKSI